MAAPMPETDYIDYGFIHCLDEEEDWRAYQKSGAFSYLMQLKEQGIVRHIGLSSHTPSTIRRVLEEAPVDMLMFSINPAYDYQKGEYAHGSVEERQEIYRRCEMEGIGISVMKPFSGGQLLDAALSPFGKALTPRTNACSMPWIGRAVPDRAARVCAARRMWNTFWAITTPRTRRGIMRL